MLDRTRRSAPGEPALYVDRLSPEEIERLERHMRDPRFSEARFLGDGESLPGRIRADAAVLRELGVTHEQVADRLESVLRGAVEGLFEVRCWHSMGWQHCPFGPDGPGACGSASMDAEIRNIRSGASIYVSELMPHLIRDHQFFEGEGLAYRLDPRQTVTVLELPTQGRPTQEKRS